jgi:hypothetical protein
MFRLSAAALAFASLVIGSSSLFADSIPYGNPGHVAPTVTLTATATGNITGYFLGSDAADTDYIRMIDVTTGVTSKYFFNNQTTFEGTSANFGHVNAGDVLEFQLFNDSSDQLFSTNPSNSSDGINHAYITSFSGGRVDGIRYSAGTYVGMEDVPYSDSDLDYNDNSFLFTNVSSTVNPPAAATPEPGSLILLGTGILGAAGTLRRRIAAR